MTASTTPTEAAFNPFTAGIEFMQQFTKNMSSTTGLGDGAMPNIPGMPAWAMPSVEPAELEKRINELKTVLFWLEQNANALKASVQALEVQKMTLETLKSMSEGVKNMSQTTPGKAFSSATKSTSRKK